MVFFIERHVYKYGGEVWKYVIFAILKKMQSNVSKREIWCEFINAFRS